MEQIIKYCEKYKIKYKTLNDGEAIIDDAIPLDIERL